MNRWGIPEWLEREVKERDKTCVYCGTKMTEQMPPSRPQKAVATWEHIRSLMATSRSPEHNRRSIRLKGYDYSQAGAYFVTICTHNRACLFGEIADGQMVLNDIGKIVADEWMKSGEIRNEIELDEWVVMPNHFHGIVIIRRGDRPVAPTLPGPRPKSIGSLISGFKSAVTKRINESRNTPGAKLWQRNYYEHIIRNEDELNRIRGYITNNPMKWEFDRENPAVPILETAAAQRKEQS